MNSLILLITLVSLGAVAPASSCPSRAPHSPSCAPDQSRVWSNDDVNFLRENAPISIIGVVNPAPTPAAPADNSEPAPYIKEDDPHWYEDEIGFRRAAIADIDAQLAHIASAENGGQGITGAFPLAGGTPGILLQGTVYVLQQERRELKREIEDLQDLGQQNQIAPVAWR